jgi:predicted DsbA family dithiol-disulfide isomerase
MPDLESLQDELGGESSLSSFSLEESQALADLAVLVIMVDHKVTDEELAELSESLRELPFDSERDVEEALGEHMEAAKKAAEAFEEDDSALDDYIAERAKVIEPEDHREAALEKLAELIYSDGAAADEESILHRIGKAFGMDSQKVQDALMHGSIDNILD